jgi:hypothetical protein
MEKIKNISYVVISALNRLKLDVSENYDWAETIAIEWMEDVASIGIKPSVETDEFFVGNGSRIYQMPSRFIRHTRVGYKVGNVIYDLTVNNDLSYSISDVACRSEQTNPNESEGSIAFPLDVYQSSFGRVPFYGVGGGRNIAYYKVDQTERQILFSMDAGVLPNGKAIIEFLSTGANVTGNTLVNPICVEVLRNYLIWQLSRMSDDKKLFSQQEIRMQEFYESEFNHKGAYLPTVQEVLDTLNSVPAFNLGR